MAKIKLKIIKIFFRLRKLLVVFGLILSVSLFFFSVPASAAQTLSLDWSIVSSNITQSSPEVTVGSSDWEVWTDQATSERFYSITTSPYGSSFSAGFYTLHVVISFPACMNSTLSFEFVPEFGSFHSGSVGFSSDPYSFLPVAHNITQTGRSWKVSANTPQNYTVSYAEFRFNFSLLSSTTDLLSFLAFLHLTPYTPISSAEQNNFSSPDSGTVDEFDEMESGLAEDSADQFEEGYSWLMGFQRFLNNTWTLQALSGITKFINYLTGQESMNGHVYADWDYFMKPLFFALAIGILPFILGIPLRFLRSGSKK